MALILSAISLLGLAIYAWAYLTDDTEPAHRRPYLMRGTR